MRPGGVREGGPRSRSERIAADEACAFPGTEALRDR